MKLNGWMWRHCRTLLGKRLIGLEFDTPFCNLSSQMVTQISQVPVWIIDCCGVCKRFRGFLNSLVPDGLP